MTNLQYKVLEELKRLKKEQTRQFLNLIAITLISAVFVSFLPSFLPGDNAVSDFAFMDVINKIASWISKLFPIVAALFLIVILILWSIKTIQLDRLKDKIEKEIEPAEIDKILTATAFSYFLEQLEPDKTTEQQ